MRSRSDHVARTRRPGALCVIAVVGAALATAACNPAPGWNGRSGARSACEDFKLTMADATGGVITHDQMVARLEGVHASSDTATPAVQFSAERMLDAARSDKPDLFLRAVADMTMSCELTGN